ncbi:hypothetical protein CRM22_010229 [Opisthorchis felineus]|uniref:Uncharacterized protein n=1 Tax=Opisthorchis felineus TaxID=147828 RepID=A0A4S2L0R1_OPIFE|nr:hypothetical protein CRM22_010229 [Opisthorchis felineus]
MHIYGLQPNISIGERKILISFRSVPCFQIQTYVTFHDSRGVMNVGINSNMSSQQKLINLLTEEINMGNTSATPYMQMRLLIPATCVLECSSEDTIHHVANSPSHNKWTCRLSPATFADNERQRSQNQIPHLEYYHPAKYAALYNSDIV